MSGFRSELSVLWLGALTEAKKAKAVREGCGSKAILQNDSFFYLIDVLPILKHAVRGLGGYRCSLGGRGTQNMRNTRTERTERTKCGRSGL